MSSIVSAEPRRSESVEEIISVSPEPSAVSQLSHAARIMAVEPWTVVAASSDVVPVMPMFSCTTWMASTMSA